MYTNISLPETGAQKYNTNSYKMNVYQPHTIYEYVHEYTQTITCIQSDAWWAWVLQTFGHEIRGTRGNTR